MRGATGNWRTTTACRRPMPRARLISKTLRPRQRICRACRARPYRPFQVAGELSELIQSREEADARRSDACGHAEGPLRLVHKSLSIPTPMSRRRTRPGPAYWALGRPIDDVLRPFHSDPDVFALAFHPEATSIAPTTATPPNGAFACLRRRSARDGASRSRRRDGVATRDSSAPRSSRRSAVDPLRSLPSATTAAASSAQRPPCGVLSLLSSALSREKRELVPGFGHFCPFSCAHMPLFCPEF